MSSQYLKALKLLVLVFHLFFNQLYMRLPLFVDLLSMSFFKAGLRDSEIRGSSSNI